MSVLRFAIAAAGVVLALGGGAAFAAPAIANRDAHGDAVAAAAKGCPSGARQDRDAHSDCVSQVADSRAGKPAEQEKTSSTQSQAGHRDPEPAAARPSKQATTTTGSSASTGDQHGDAVAAAAKACPSGNQHDRDAHGDCVSGVARQR